ncbi:MAG: polysaccharide pyruvyl transferase family protein [Clostridia bacterium]|nr:polysaccharide pyruvyl transferase family protein [Clostridia bacterium]
MKKIRTITFHSAYNYGANLQAYALQEYIKELAIEKGEDIDFKIINLRTIKRDIEYDYSNKKIKGLIKNLLTKNSLVKKSKKFENFFAKYYMLTKEYKSNDELKIENFDNTYLISGSDQIWNIKTFDFDWSYWLDFSNTSIKISYAPSFGQNKIEFTRDEENKIKDSIMKYNYLSVRDVYSQNIIKKITGRESIVLVDPTMLLSKEKWDRLIDKNKLIAEEYILVYLIQKGKNADKIYKEINKYARKKNLKVVIITQNLKIDWKYNFIKKYDIATLEFLNLIKHAKLIITTSFHGTIFSILFNKHFLCINGDKDNRIKTLLELTELEKQTIDIEKICDIDPNEKISFEASENNIKKEIEKSKDFLIQSLNLNESNN